MCQETTGKKTKIQQLYELYKTNPKLGNAEAAELLDTNERCIRIYRARLIEKGCVQYTEAGGMEVVGSYKNPELKVGPEYKAEVYKIYYNADGTEMDRMLYIRSTYDAVGNKYLIGQ